MLWQLAGLMVELDWPIDSATFVTFQGELHIMLSFRRPNADRYRAALRGRDRDPRTLGDLSGCRR